ncbi:A-kinase anchor protein 13 isoform X2 [Sorex araneus]|uniref:A-kinase anchor protein 13 isoform X2 n=1 Tax=Sorex araneus TaxID=42254 RepID=UPI0024338888|nr:A-kinase anchor protein 13 isoform X2 [Sorex araneus]
MKLNPQQAPLYGDCVVTVLLAEEDKLDDDVVFYLVFLGSSLHHCSSTRKVSADTLETVAPGHDCCETVKVLLCASREGHPVLVVTEGDFQFIQDEAYDAAQFLATSAGNQQALNFTRFLDRSGPLTGDVDSLDRKVALAFRHLKLPADWNVLGPDQTLHDGAPRETLMHFAVRLGLLRLTWLLLQKPGGRRALSVHNQEGATPGSLALERGYHQLHQLLTQEDAGEPDCWSCLSQEVPCGSCSLKHRRDLDVYTLTSESGAQHGPASFPEGCTAPVSKLRNLQQQLMKTHLKPMDNPMPLMVTAQDPPHLPSAAAPSDSCPPCPAEPEAGQQLSPPADSDHAPSHFRSPVGPAGASGNLSSVIKGESTGHSCQEGMRSAEREGGEAALLSPADSGEGRGLGGLLAGGTQHKGAGVRCPGGTEQEPPASGDAPLLGLQLLESGIAQPDSAEVPAVGAAAGDGVPEPAAVTECRPRSLAAAVPGVVPEAGRNVGDRLENLGSGVAGVSDASVTSSHVPTTGSLGSDAPSSSSLAFSGREPIPGSSVGAGSSGSTGTATHQDPCQDGAVAHGEAAGTAGRCPDCSSPRPEAGVLPQKSQPDSLPLPSPPPDCCPRGGDPPGTVAAATSTVPQSKLTSGGVGAVEPSAPSVTLQAESAPIEGPRVQLSTAGCCPGPPTGPATPDSDSTPWEPVDWGPLSVSDTEGHGRDWKPAGSLTTPLEGTLHPHLVPSMESELGSGQVVTSDRTFSPAGSVGSESVTRDDVLVSVPSQKEKGTATPGPPGPSADGHDPHREVPAWEEQLLPDHPAHQPGHSPAHDLPPSMGNASPAGLGSDTEDPCAPAAPRGPSSDGDTGPSLLSGGKVLLASDFILKEDGRTPMVLESSAAQGPEDKGEATLSSSMQEVAPSAGTLLGEQRVPPGQQAPGHQLEPSSSACAQDKALSRPPLGVPLASQSTEHQQNKEVALPDVLPPAGAAAQHALPTVDSSPRTPGAEQSSPEAAEALLHPRCTLDAAVENTPAQGSSAVSAARGTERSHSSCDIPRPKVSWGQVTALNPDLPEASPSPGMPGWQAAVAAEGALDIAPLQPVVGVGPVPAAPALQMPPRACTDRTIEEAASRIVNAVIQQVRASGALGMAGSGHPLSPSALAELDAASEQPQELAPVGTTGAILPGETPSRASVHEDPVTLSGREEPERKLPCVPGPALAAEMPDTKAEDGVDFLGEPRGSAISEEASGEASPPKMKHSPKTQVINRESWCTIEPCPDAASLLTPTTSPESFLDVGLGSERTTKPGALPGGAGSDCDLFHSPSEDVDSAIFSRPEEEQLGCDLTGSSSCTDDSASLDRHSSLGSDVSLPHVAHGSRPRDQPGLEGAGSPEAGATGRQSARDPAGSGDLEDEETDSVTEVPSTRSVLRSSMRSLSPFRRHSWGPGKNAASDAEMNHRSSLRILGDIVRRPPLHRRSLSWCPSGVPPSAALSADFHYRSFSLEGLAGGAGAGGQPCSSLDVSPASTTGSRHPFSSQERRGSLVSLSEEDLESGQTEHRRVFDPQTCHRSKPQGFNYCTSAISSPLTKSISLMTISHPGLDNSRPFHTTSANLTESITEESYNFLPPSPSKKDLEGKSGTKVSRTFSYIRNKMSSSKKSREKEKEKEKIKEKEKDLKEKEKDKKIVNGHTFSSVPTVGPISCSQCSKPFSSKEAYTCAGCGALVHKGCRESLASCAKVKMKQPRGSLQAQDTSSLPTVIMRNKPSQPKERPRSAVLLADETTTAPLFVNRRSQQTVSLSKSISIQNIAGVGSDESMSTTWKFLSHSTDSLNKISKVNESTESLTDEGTDMNEGQLMGDFEAESKLLEAESWSRTVDSKFLKQQKKEVVKRQEVIYELMQTELHHLRTLKIMSDVYSRGMMTELLFEQQTVDQLFPCLDELLSIHSQFLQRILERRKESLVDRSDRNFLIRRIGDVLVNQFSGENAERLKKTYGKFCGQHNQSVSYFKDLYTRDKRFQAFVKKKMSSSVVRRLGIPECILLVTQRITKYPVLFQRILQCTKDNDAEQEEVAQSLSLVKDVIGAVDSKVASYEKKVRLNEIYMKTDSKSIMRMKSGQMLAKEDLKRKKLVRDGSVFLKSAAGRLKEVQAVLLSDILVFLQEKDQKYVFASLDQKSTVISLKKLIVREVAHEEKGLFLISMGGKDPEMVEVHASSKEERNSWIQTIQDTINTLNRDEDEGVPSESEEEKRLLDTRARELKEQLQQKDQQILLLLEEKEMIFRDMAFPEDASPGPGPRTLFRSNTEEALRGAPLMKSAISEVEALQSLVSGSLGGSLGPAVSSPTEQDGAVGPVSLPRRAETFGGFDSHQMSACKGGEKDEGDDGQDLRRTESDSGLKKGGNANLVFMLKRNSEVVQSVAHLHELLSSLQGVVLQQDSYIEDQKLLLSERVPVRHSARPSSLAEQEKQRSLEKQRQELAELQRQQAQHLDEQRRRERQWDARERALQEREARLAQREDEVRRGQRDLECEREALQQRRGAYQAELERLRAAQKQLEREQEQLRRDSERLGPRPAECEGQGSRSHAKLLRIPSFLPNPEEPPPPSTPPVAKSGSLDSDLSVSPKRNSLSRTHKDKGPFHLLSSAGQTHRQPEGQSPAPVASSTRLFGLAKPKEKKKEKKKGRGSRAQSSDGPVADEAAEGEEIFC